MKLLYQTLLTSLLWVSLFVSTAQADCCNAGFSSFHLPQSNGLNAFQFVMDDSTAADIQSIQWGFGDGTYSNSANPRHLYNYTGTYAVTLTVFKQMVDGVQKSCSETRNLLVDGTCSNFIYHQLNRTVTFVQTAAFDIDSTSAWAQSRTFLWTFGDGQTSTELNPVHTYAQEGSYTACLYQYRNDSAFVDSCYTCKSFFIEDTLAPIICNAAFSYSLTDSLISLQGNSPTGSSYWWVVGDTTLIGYGNNVQFGLPSHPFTVCHRQYTDSIPGSDNTYCTECAYIYPPVDTIPVCNAGFALSIADSIIYLQRNAALGVSQWWIEGDTSLSWYGNNVHFVMPSEPFNICHRQYMDSIVGPGSAYCTECVVIRPPVDTISSSCNADFDYSLLSDSAVAVNAVDSARISYWFYTINGLNASESYYGSNAIIPVPANGELAICHYKFSDMDSCFVCKTVRQDVDTIPVACNSDFDYTVIGNTIFTYTDSADYFGNSWNFSNEATAYDTLAMSHVFNSPGVKRICQSRISSTYADTCKTCKDILIEAAEISIHPNPAVHNINIRSKDGVLSSIEIYDINGMQVKNITALDSNKYIVNVSDLVNGIYYVSTVLVDGRVNKTKIIVQ